MLHFCPTLYLYTVSTTPLRWLYRRLSHNWFILAPVRYQQSNHVKKAVFVYLKRSLWAIKPLIFAQSPHYRRTWCVLVSSSICQFTYMRSTLWVFGKKKPVDCNVQNHIVISLVFYQFLDRFNMIDSLKFRLLNDSSNTFLEGAFFRACLGGVEYQVRISLDATALGLRTRLVFWADMEYEIYFNLVAWHYSV